VTHFRDLPIRRKLLLMTLTSTAVALTFAGVGFLAWDIVQFRSEARQDLTAQAAIIAENSGAPLVFRDDRVAHEILQVLRLRPQVALACLYQHSGTVLTSYHRDGRGRCASQPSDASTFGWLAFDVVWPVVTDRKRVGTLSIHRELVDMYARLRVGLMTVVGLLLLASAAAFLTSTRMQRSIAAPLLQLADTARAISKTRNYSLRAAPASKDEIGVVIHSFNEMLDRIAEAIESEREASHVRASLQEKEVLLKEIHHRVKNNLQVISSLLNLQAQQIVDPADRALFAESQSRVQSIALVHEKLYQSPDLSQIQFEEYVQALVSNLFHSLDAAERGVVAKVAAGGVRLPVDVAIPCGLIINELVTNSLKHAFPDGRKGCVEVLLHSSDQRRLELVVRDDGVGLPSELDPRHTSSLGLDLVYTFADQLEAAVDVRRSPGTAFSFAFPRG
jgi:two-component sensor histidine kinase